MNLFAGQSREALRQSYREAWRKWRERTPLQPLEAQIADVVLAHPQYQPLLQSQAGLEREFADQASENPFLHMGLHLALREQISTDRPHGIAAVRQRLAATLHGGHAAEHRMIEVLMAMLSEAQRSGQAPNESVYLERLQRL